MVRSPYKEMGISIRKVLYAKDTEYSAFPITRRRRKKTRRKR